MYTRGHESPTMSTESASLTALTLDAVIQAVLARNDISLIAVRSWRRRSGS